MTSTNPSNQGRWAALAALNLAAVLFGAIALFGRIDASPVWIVAGRTFFGALTLLAVALARRVLARPTGGQVIAGAVTGALLALHWITFFWSVQTGGVAIATLTVSAFPLFTILISAVREKKPPAALEVAACVAIMIAIALIARPSGGAGVLTGAIAGLISAALFSVFSLASQGLMRALGPLNLSILQYVMATLLMAPALPFFKAVEGGSAWLAVLALGVFGTALSFQLYLFALTRLPAVVCGGFVCLEPVYAIVLAALIYREPISLLVAVSGVIIVGSSLALLRWSKAAAPGALTGAQP